jgi:acetoin utilization protein AcuB
MTKGENKMLVKDWMSKDIISIEPNDSMHNATKLLKEHNIKMLPVINNNKLVGVVTDRDLKQAMASDATSLEIHELVYLLMKIKIKDIMTKKPITVHRDFTVEETAEILLHNRISGVPVVDGRGNVVGIITQTDLFRVLISLTGVSVKGIQFALLIKDQPGTIKEVADIVREFGGRIVSILTSYDDVFTGYRKVYIRMHSIEHNKLKELRDALVNKASLIYMIDHRENYREVNSIRAH